MVNNKFGIYDDLDFDKGKTINFKNKIILIVIVGFSLISIVLLLWYGYKNLTTTEDSIKVIAADKSEKKIKPQNPGGMEFPDIDKDVFNKFSSHTKANKIERILPAPEEPVTKKELDTHNLLDEEKIILKAEPDEKIITTVEEEEIEKNQPLLEVTETKIALDLKTPSVQNQDKTPSIMKDVSNNEPQSNIKKLPEGSNFGKQDFNKSDIVKTYRVQLSSLKNEKDAIKLWDSLVKKSDNLLDNNKYFIEKKIIPNKGLFYRLQVANMTSESEAGEFCKKLKNKNIDCFIVRPEQ